MNTDAREGMKAFDMIMDLDVLAAMPEDKVRSFAKYYREQGQNDAADMVERVADTIEIVKEFQERDTKTLKEEMIE